MSMLWWMLACGGPEGAPVAPPAPQVEAGAPAQAVAAAPPAAVARTVLAGTLRLDDGVPSFTPCAEGEPAPANALGPFQDEVRGLFPGTQVVYVELRAVQEGGAWVAQGVDTALVEGVGCQVRAAPWRVRAMGNEPFWSVEVDEAHITYRDAEGAVVVAPLEAGSDPAGLTWGGTGEQGPVRLELVEARCRDTMADAAYPLSAKVTVGERVRVGCARRRPGG